MRAEEVEVGEEYAVRASEASGLTRVRVISIDPERDLIDERSGAGWSGERRVGWPTGRKRRCARVQVLSGTYVPYGAYGADDIYKDEEGLIPLPHIRRPWQQVIEARAKRESNLAEQRAHAEYGEELSVELTERIRSIGVQCEIDVRPMRYGTFEGILEIDSKVLEELVDRAEAGG